MIFLEDEIIRLCEHHRMHAVQIDGQWSIDASVLSPFTRDFKTMPLWFQKAIINKDREKNNHEGNPPTIPTYIIRAGFILISLNVGADVYHTSA